MRVVLPNVLILSETAKAVCIYADAEVWIPKSTMAHPGNLRPGGHGDVEVDEWFYQKVEALQKWVAWCEEKGIRPGLHPSSPSSFSAPEMTATQTAIGAGEQQLNLTLEEPK